MDENSPQPGVETTTSTPSTTEYANVGAAIDAAQAAEATPTPRVESQPESPAMTDTSPVPDQTAESGEDRRDWKTYGRKLLEENREFKQLFREQQAKEKESQPVGMTPQPEVATALPGSDDEALSLLKNLMRSTVEEAIGPIKSTFQQQSEERVLDEFGKQPYVKELTPEINQELSKVDPRLPLVERLDYARAQAIAKNLDTIIRVNAEVVADRAREEAYGNKELKLGQAGGGARPNSANQPQDDLLDRVKSGNISTREYAERRGEIDELIYQDTFSSS